jgi:hypothetical protein
MEPKETLATELLHEVKRSSKRNFVLFIITLVMLFLTNALWLYAWTLPVEETSNTVTTTTSVDQDSQDNDVNTYIDSEGDINYGETNN